MFKKISILIAAFALSAAAVNAQKTMYIMKDGVAINSYLIKDIDSVIFYAPPEPPEPEVCPEPEPPCPVSSSDYIVFGGVKWAKSNLDVGGVFAANPWDYGALYQWGRKSDGHESRTSEIYPNNNTTPEPGAVDASELNACGQIPNGHAAHGMFIKNNESSVTVRNWRTPADDALWNAGDDANPVKTVNDPCPCGWRLPTETELQSLSNAGTWQTNYSGSGINGHLVTGSTLFFPAAGRRNADTGAISSGPGYYWSSSVSGVYGACIWNSEGGNLGVSSSNFRATGFSVRCVVDE